MAGSGRSPLVTTTAVLPVAMTGASTLTRPSRLEPGGARMATTPVGSGTLKLKYGPATGLAAPATAATLSVQPAYQTHRSIAAPTWPAAGFSAVAGTAAEPGAALRAAAEFCMVMPSAAATSAANWAARPSMTSATRYRTWPRL